MQNLIETQADWDWHLTLCDAWESGISLADAALALSVFPSGPWRVAKAGTPDAKWMDDRVSKPGVILDWATYKPSFTPDGELVGAGVSTDITAEARRERAAQDADERAVERENEREAEAMSDIASRVDDAVLAEMEADAWRGRRARSIRASERARKGADHWGGDWAVGGDLTEVIDSTPWNPEALENVQFFRHTDREVYGSLNAAGPRKWDHMADEHLREMAAIDRKIAEPIGERDYSLGAYLWRQSHTRYHRTAKVLAWVANPATPTTDLLKARGFYDKRRKESQAVKALGLPTLPKGPWPGVEGRPGVGLVRKYQEVVGYTNYGEGGQGEVTVTRFPDWSACYLTSDQADRIESAIADELERRQEAASVKRATLKETQRQAEAAWRAGLGTVGTLKRAI